MKLISMLLFGFFFSLHAAEGDMENNSHLINPVSTAPSPVSSMVDIPLSVDQEEASQALKFDPENLPAYGSTPNQKAARKLACLFCLYSPCLCCAGCFNALTSCLDRMMGHHLYALFPCLDCDQ